MIRSLMLMVVLSLAAVSASARNLTWIDAPDVPGEQIIGYAVFEVGNDTSLAYIEVGQPLEYETGSDDPGCWYLRTVAVSNSTEVVVVDDAAMLDALVSVPSVVLCVEIVCSTEVVEGAPP